MGILASFSILNNFSIGFCILTILNFPTTDGVVAESVFLCEQPLRSPTHQFPSKNRANGVRATLGYGDKPYWPMQWYMNEEMFSVANEIYSPPMKIVEFHNLELKGENVGVVIIGNSPVNCEHSEIKQRCFPDSSLYSYHAKKGFTFPLCTKPKVCLSNSLATAVAGIIGMTDKFQNCGVGIAPRCRMGNIIVEPSTKSGSPEHGAYKILSALADPGTYVFVHAWSLSSFDHQSRILHALDDINMLNYNPNRQMRPHVMGSGDLGQYANSCQCNEYTSADSMFVFGSVAYDGFLTSYSETCASLIGVTYSTSYGNEFYNNILTITDSTNDSPTYAPKRTTVVSAAIGGGIVALLNEVYFETFYRSPSISDVAFLLAFSCTSDGLKNKNTLWFTNGVGKEYSPQAGFGLPRMDELFTLVKGWTPMGPPTIYKFSRFSRHVEFKCHKDTRTKSLTYMFNLVCFFEINNAQAHRYIQQITIELSAKFMKRGALSVYLISPAGTVSCILEGRPYDVRKGKYKKLLLRTNHFIGETLQGQWSIRFHTYQEDSRPSYERLWKYSFPTHQQSTTVPPKPQFDNTGHHQPNTPGGPSSSNPQSVNSNSQSPVSGSSQYGGQLVVGGVSSPKTIYPILSPNPTGASTNSVPIVSNVNSLPQNSNSDPKSDHQSPPNQRAAESPNEIRYTATNPPNKPYADLKQLNPNTIDEVSFRFLLVENLPSILKIQELDKSKKQTKLDFELMKAWVDFRNYLWVQTDPKNFGTSIVGLWEVYDISNHFIKKLLRIQEKLKIDSATTPSPVKRLQQVFGSDLFPDVQTSETSSKSTDGSL